MRNPIDILTAWYRRREIARWRADLKGGGIHVERYTDDELVEVERWIRRRSRVDHQRDFLLPYYLGARIREIPVHCNMHIRRMELEARRAVNVD